jgi:LysM repeat protein
MDGRLLVLAEGAGVCEVESGCGVPAGEMVVRLNGFHKNFHGAWHRACWIIFHVMNASNPFQIPSCLQASLQQRQRERFKKGVIVAVAALVALLAGLLILGCKNEHARTASALMVSTRASTLPATSVAASTTEPNHGSIQTSPVPSPIAALSPAPIVSKEGAAVTIYLVKPADTLSRIAKAHGTTVNALKGVNGLDTDQISIGMKLKLPEA